MDCLFINGIIKSKTFLNEHQFCLLSTSKKDNFVKMLNDFNYGYTSNKQTISGLLRQEDDKLMKELEFLLDKNHYLLKSLKFIHDLINLKVLFKEIYLDIPLLNNFDEFGNFSKAALINAIKFKNYELLKEDENLFIQLNKIDLKLSLYEVSNEISKITYNYVYKKYIEKKNKYLKQYFKVKMTIINIETILRSIRLNLSYELILNSLVDNSLVSNDKLLEYIYVLRNPSGLNFYLPILFSKVLSSIKYDDLIDLETEFNDLILLLMDEFDNEVDTYAPLISYIYRKKNEMNRIRNIYYIHKTNFIRRIKNDK